MRIFKGAERAAKRLMPEAWRMYFRASRYELLMRRLAPRVAAWAERCHAPQHPLTGDFLPDDAVPASLMPLLAMFADQQWPVLRATAEALETWAEGQDPGAEVPRILGFHKARIGHGERAVETDRAIIPYPLWMLQRVTDHLDLLPDRDRGAAEDLVREIGAPDLADWRLPVRLQRRHFKLHLAD